MRGGTVAAQQHRRPHVAGIAETVQHDDGGSLAAHTHMDGRAVGLDVPSAKAAGKRLDQDKDSQRLRRRFDFTPKHRGRKGHNAGTRHIFDLNAAVRPL
jgi:hypothetical protein